STCSSWSGFHFQCSCHHGLQAPRFSRTGPVTQKSLSRYDRNSGGGRFVFNFGTVDLAVRKERHDSPSTATSTVTGNLKIQVSVQNLSAN
ncbi:mCG125115, partial [Mus musculus]